MDVVLAQRMLRPVSLVLSVFAFGVAGLVACAADPTGGPPPDNENQDSGTPPPTQSGPDAKAPVCPGVGGTYPALPAAGNVLFLMDRSGSMQIKLTDKA